MPSLYENKSYVPVINAQNNLMGRTHYVDPDTLKFHKVKLVESNVHDNGLLFSIIESVALDWGNTKRGFRYVVFDLFGHVVSRVPLEACVKTRAQAHKALYEYLETVDAVQLTKEGLESWKKQNQREEDYTFEIIQRFEKERKEE